MTSKSAPMLAALLARAKPSSLCWLCHEPASAALCQCCLHDLPDLGRCCQRCGEPGPSPCKHCRQRPPDFDRLVAGYRYGPPLDRALQAFKHHRQWWLDAMLCQPLLARLGEQPQPECLVPVPLHWRRRLWRGFNQAELIARQLGNALALPVNCRLCRRHRATARQQGQSRRQRLSNLNGAFSLSGPVPEHVAIVDDVVTTGSTVNLLAKLLKAHGCQQVQVWCLARA